jgi:hypothetical protein
MPRKYQEGRNKGGVLHVVMTLPKQHKEEVLRGVVRQ